MKCVPYADHFPPLNLTDRVILRYTVARRLTLPSAEADPTNSVIPFDETSLMKYALSYAERPRRRHAWRWISILFVLLAIGASVRYGSAVWNRLQLLRFQSECLKFALDLRQVDYAEGSGSPMVSSSLRVTHQDNFGFNADVGSPRCWASLIGAAKLRWRYPRDSFLFMHKLQAKGGQARLVIVTRMDCTRQFSRMCAGIRVRTFEPATLVSTLGAEHELGTSISKGKLNFLREYTQSVHFYAGQPDPSDPAHFTIEYDIDGVRGIMDGRLTKDDYVKVEIRSGPGLKPS